MPSNLNRFQHTGQNHFVTFSCYQGRQLLAEPAGKQTFEAALERVRVIFELDIYGYVVMPDHVHLLVAEPRRKVLCDAIQSLKLRVSKRLIGDAEHFWQSRYLDFNIRDPLRFREKLRYLHRSPVVGGLCQRPEDWEWSSFRHYATGIEGRVEIESEWTVKKRSLAAGKICQPVDVPDSSQNPA